MTFLVQADPNGTTFKVLLIASEIIIPLIVFVGAYFIFKPLFEKKDEAEKPEEIKEGTDKLPD